MNYSLLNIIQSLAGPINPVGETYTDEKRYTNLTHTIQLVDDLLREIIEVAKYKNRDEYSMKKAGQVADRYLADLKTKTLSYVETNAALESYRDEYSMRKAAETEALYQANLREELKDDMS